MVSCKVRHYLATAGLRPSFEAADAVTIASYNSVKFITGPHTSIAQIEWVMLYGCFMVDSRSATKKRTHIVWTGANAYRP